MQRRRRVLGFLAVGVCLSVSGCGAHPAVDAQVRSFRAAGSKDAAHGAAHGLPIDLASGSDCLRAAVAEVDRAARNHPAWTGRQRGSYVVAYEHGCNHELSDRTGVAQ